MKHKPKVLRGCLYNDSPDDFNILSNNFIIPSTQRAYKWKKKQIDEVIDDIECLRLEKDNDFLHYNAITLQEVKNEKDTYSIIDGQQRIVTFNIMLSAFYHFIESIRNSNSKNYKNILDFQDILIPFSPNNKGLIAFSKDGSRVIKKEPLITFPKEHEGYNNFFKTIISSPLDSFEEKIDNVLQKEKNEKVLSNIENMYSVFNMFYEYFKNTYESNNDYLKLENLIKQYLGEVYINLTIKHCDSDNIRQFIKMNTTNMPLTYPEIVKTILYEKIQKEYSIEEAEEYSKKWINNYESYDSEFWNNTVSKTGNDRLHESIRYSIQAIEPKIRISKKQSEISKNIRDILYTNDSLHIGKRLLNNIDFYKKLVDDSIYPPTNIYYWYKETYNNVSQNNDKSIIHILMCIEEKCNGTVEEKTEILKLLNKVNFNISLGTGSEKNNLNRLIGYSKITKKDFANNPFYKDEITLENVKKFINENYSYIYSTNELCKMIMENTYSKDFNISFTKLSVYQNNLKNYESMNYDSMVTLTSLFDKASTEHILPIKPENYSYMNAEEQALYDRKTKYLGNLITFSLKSNSSIKNSNIISKMNFYKKEFHEKQSLVFSNGIARVINIYEKENKWDINEIVENTKYYAELFSKTYGIDLEDNKVYKNSFLKSFIKNNKKLLNDYNDFYLRKQDDTLEMFNLTEKGSLKNNNIEILTNYEYKDFLKLDYLPNITNSHTRILVKVNNNKIPIKDIFKI